jgi:Coenzyme PQQ synthesis protein D (PqqD)
VPAPTITTAHDYLAVHVVIPYHVVFRAFPAQTVVLHLQTGRYHWLNPTAGRMLELLAETGSVATAATRLARQTEQPLARVQSDLCDLCSDLAERGLLEVAGERAR